MDYIPNTDAQLDDMLKASGVSSLEDLLRGIPESLRAGELPVPAGLAEAEVIDLMERLAARNRPLSSVTSFLGAGCYDHLIPTVVDAVAARGEWLTPYTPYQAEASQGILQALYEFQTMVCELFQMEVANASLYDGASSVAEAATLALRATGRPRLLVSEAVHPHARETLATYLTGASAVIQQIPTVNGVTDLEALHRALRDDVALVILQQPNIFGCVEPMGPAADAAHRFGSLFAASVYPVSLGLLQPPGAYGADIAVGEGRCLGSPPAYGGPGLGLFTTSHALLRKVPGRLAGCTVDQSGRRGFTLTLQTREQHIRREKATSNICTNEGWLTLRATVFLSLLGPEGMRELARLNYDKAHYAQQRLLEVPWLSAAFDQPFFNEFTLRHDARVPMDRVRRRLARRGLVAGAPLGAWYPGHSESTIWCVTERVSRSAIDELVETLKGIR